MTDFTENNLAALAGDRHILRLENTCGKPTLTAEKCRKEGLFTVSAPGPEGKIYLHSTFDPATEAQRWAEQALAGSAPARALVFGFGLGYHVEALIAANPDLADITVVEANPAVFRAALSTRDMTTLFSDPRLRVIAGPYPDIAEHVPAAVESFMEADSSGLYIHRPSLRTLPEDASELREILDFIQLHSGGNDAFPELRESNSRENASAFDAAPGVSSLFGSLAGKPAIVAAAGPSLDTSLEIMKNSAARPAFIAVDSALGPIHAAGLHPDYVLTGDPQKESFHLFDGLPTTEEKLVFFPTSCPAAVNYFPPERRLAAISPTAKDGVSRSPAAAGKGELFLSGTIFLAAVDFAVKLGASPIVIVGADFSFDHDRTHATGSRTQGYVPRFGRKREIPAIGGGTVTTSEILYLYLRDFERYCAGPSAGVTIVNCTARGAAVSGVPESSLDSFLNKYMRSGRE